MLRDVQGHGEDKIEIFDIKVTRVVWMEQLVELRLWDLRCRCSEVCA